MLKQPKNDRNRKGENLVGHENDAKHHNASVASATSTKHSILYKV